MLIVNTLVNLFSLSNKQLAVRPTSIQFDSLYFLHSLVLASINLSSQSCQQMMLDAVEEVGGIYLVTADHGNAEDMVKRNPKTTQPLLDKSGNIQILTSHTCSPVIV